MKIKYIIFSDLDGTILDHHTYSFEEAIPALKLVKKLHVPLILVSSKTRLELLYIQEQLGLVDLPFVIENGAAIFTPPLYFNALPNGEQQGDLYCYRLGKSYPEIKQILQKISRDYDYVIKGYHNATPEEISGKTSLRGEALIRSLSREFSVPLFYDARAEEIIKSELSKYDLQLLYGGRFMHLLSKVDKGSALQLIMQGYRSKYQTKNLKSIALGDSLNDFAMLDQSDIPVLVKKFDGTYESRGSLNKVNYTQDIGPRGWNQFILDFLYEGGKNE
jgi:mannosyl-3-phosphoglycerate phosphatase